MLSLKVRRRSPIYRLGAKGYMGSAQHARADARRMIQGRSRMIQAGPDDPGGGPEELETRLVVMQVRMSGSGSGCPGRVRMIRLQVGASGVFWAS